jgi:hypothetical protein
MTDKETDKAIYDVEMRTLYELRLMFAQSDKEQYTKEEIADLLDKIAMAKRTV